MRMNISAWSICSPMPAIVTSLVLVILGLFSFKSLPITRIPNIDIPIVQVSITQSGAAPGELETQVTRKIEDAIAGVNGIWHIMSAVSDGSSVTTIQFYIGTN
ncbi:MAG: efflux RND transporter permease subunit, partial [Xanthobacteraceae bacterium]|nr:efflux RND transporter permease subunit [Xanthobacteraceae bacterium]